MSERGGGEEGKRKRNGMKAGEERGFSRERKWLLIIRHSNL